MGRVEGFRLLFLMLYFPRDCLSTTFPAIAAAAMVFKTLLLVYVGASDAAAERANPICKVVDMLQAMRKKMESGRCERQRTF